MEIFEIKNFMKKNKISYAQLAEMTGLSVSTITKIFGGFAKYPRIDTMQAIERALGLEQPQEKRTLHGKWIPVYGQIAAGIPIEAIEDIIDEEEISADMASHGEYIALKVKGSSMEPRIADGDVVILRLQETIENNGIAAVYVNGNDVTLKRVRYEENGLWLIGLNPAFPPLFYTKQQCQELPIRILGKLVELRAKF